MSVGSVAYRTTPIWAFPASTLRRLERSRIKLSTLSKLGLLIEPDVSTTKTRSTDVSHAGNKINQFSRPVLLNILLDVLLGILLSILLGLLLGILLGVLNGILFGVLLGILHDILLGLLLGILLGVLNGILFGVLLGILLGILQEILLFERWRPCIYHKHVWYSLGGASLHVRRTKLSTILPRSLM